ncbi:MAG TPA: response regulator [Candidatus Sumerlaeota bacterium]|nr:response regulator [Candidatus Sumerlaeota bacterium]HNM46129.1 response regulator [Candidatus Sumerlaeota bacterium]
MKIGPMAAKTRLLVADDDATLLSLLKKTLAREGFDVETARNGEEALCLLTDSGNFDLLITDVRMPVKNGEELLRDARKLCPGLKVIFITGYCEQDERGRICSQGDCEIIAKPFKIPDLLEVIDRSIAVSR